MPITKYENTTLTKQCYVIEECCFINCVLSECHLFYSGGDLETLNCRFENCHWHFRGAALKTMQTLQQIGILKPLQAPVSMPPTGGPRMN